MGDLCFPPGGMFIKNFFPLGKVYIGIMTYGALSANINSQKSH